MAPTPGGAEACPETRARPRAAGRRWVALQRGIMVPAPDGSYQLNVDDLYFASVSRRRRPPAAPHVRPAAPRGSQRYAVAVQAGSGQAPAASI